MSPVENAALPELHVYSKSLHIDAVVLRDAEGHECDLTPWRVVSVSRKVVISEIPTCTVTFMARFIEHDEVKA